MFMLTDAEKEAQVERDRLLAVLQGKLLEVRKLPRYPDHSNLEEKERRAQLEADAAEAQKAYDEAQLTEPALVAVLKTEANKVLAANLPGGSYGALLTMAEQTLGLLDTETGLRTVKLIRETLLRILGAGADMDIHMARARITKARYDSLLEVGLPADLVREIIIAEAGVPWPFPQASATSRK